MIERYFNYIEDLILVLRGELDNIINILMQSIRYKEVAIYYSMFFLNKIGVIDKSTLNQYGIRYGDRMNNENIKYLKKTFGINFIGKSNIETFSEYSTFKDFLPSDNEVVLDIGGYQGETAIFYSKICKAKKVVVVEPVSVNFKYLLKNIKNFRNIIPIKKAVSDRNEVIRIKYDPISKMGMSDAGNNFKTEKVRTITLDKLVETLGLKNVDLIKIDVEGFEMSVLKGGINMIKKFKPKLIIETHSEKLRNDVINFLEKLGYVKIKKGHTLRLISGHIRFVQTLFLKT